MNEDNIMVSPDGPAGLRRLPLWSWVVCLALPALVFGRTLWAPLDVRDDTEFSVASLPASHPLANLQKGLVQYISDDMAQNGRFRPVFCAGRIVLSRCFGTNAAKMHLPPMSMLLGCALMFLLAGRAMGMSVWPAIVLSWLIVLNPRGKEAFILLAPQEAMGMFFASVAILAMICGVTSSRKGGWDILGVLAIVVAALTKESFTLAIPGLAMARLAGKVAINGRTWLAALRRNIGVFIVFSIVFAGGLAIAYYVKGTQTYSAALLSHTDIATGFRRVVRQILGSNAYLAPVGIFLFAAILLRWRRHAGHLAGVLAVAAASLIWLIPTAGLQVMAGGALGRWIFPLTVAPAIANGIAYWRVHENSRGIGRSLAGVGMALWIVFIAGRCYGGVEEFLADARAIDHSIREINQTTPAGGRILIVPNAEDQVGMARNLQIRIAAMGRLDIHVDVLAPTADATAGDSGLALVPMSELERKLASADALPYDAVLSAEPCQPIREDVAKRLVEKYRKKQFIEPYHPLDFGQPWRKVMAVGVYFPK